jgi:redox-sensitive bicupin YhaK (pirin superfamily)
MLWAEDIPHLDFPDEQARHTSVTLIAGQLNGATAPLPAPASWAANPQNDVAIWLIDMAPDATWMLPPAQGPVNRMLYLYAGGPVSVAGTELPPNHGAELLAMQEALLRNGPARSRLVLLQGEPISEPVVQYGPFVMNTEAEIRQAFADYRRTEFGGWPWSRRDPVHGRRGRFARYADGHEETP